MSFENLNDSSLLLPGIYSEIINTKNETIWINKDNNLEKSFDLDNKHPYLFISSFSEIKRKISTNILKKTKTQIVQNKVTPPTTPNLQNTKSPPPPQIQDPTSMRPAQVKLKDENGEEWILKCVCNIKSGEGLLVGCDQCGCWQHAICMGLNSHTIPEKYLCDICANKVINCKCGNNLSFRFALIKCTKCGHYVHKRCEGIGYGMMPKGDFICHFCGKSSFIYEKPLLSNSIVLPDKKIIFSKSRVDQLPSFITSGPFTDFIENILYDNEFNSKEFCENLYDNLRSFFFVHHPRFNSHISRKKRKRLFDSFMFAIQNLCQTHYDININLFNKIFNNLIFNDIYIQNNYKIKDNSDLDLEFTENARFEIPRLTDISKFNNKPKEQPYKITSDGIICLNDLNENQFICYVEGLIGDLEEFDFNSKIDINFFAINDSRFILDTSKKPKTILHKIKRSMSGNIILKIFQVDNELFCGLFALKSFLGPYPNDDDEIINSGTPLTLSFDFIPSVVDDISKWASWKIENVINPIIPIKPLNSKNSKENLKIFKNKTRSESENNLNKRGRKIKIRTEQIQTNPFSLFSLIANDSPGNYFVYIENNENNQIIEENIINKHEEIINKPIIEKPLINNLKKNNSIENLIKKNIKPKIEQQQSLKNINQNNLNKINNNQKVEFKIEQQINNKIEIINEKLNNNNIKEIEINNEKLNNNIIKEIEINNEKLNNNNINEIEINNLNMNELIIYNDNLINFSKIEFKPLTLKDTSNQMKEILGIF